MFYGKSKRIVIIKDIHSNLFEEAILVLKEDSEQEQEKNKQIYASKIPNYKNDFILKEAEAIINNYIKENKHVLNQQNNKEAPKDNKTKNKLTDPKFKKNLIINTALVGSIIAVAFILTKII